MSAKPRWDELSESQKNTLCAEAMGYDLGMPPDPTMALPPGRSYPVTVPRYTTDASATRLLIEEVRRRNKITAYLFHLGSTRMLMLPIWIDQKSDVIEYTFDDELKPMPTRYVFDFIDASLDQQCHAFALTVGAVEQ